MNRQPVTPLAVLGLWVACLVVSSALADDLSSLQSRLAKQYPATRFTSVTASPVPGWYEVVMGENVAYVDAAGRHFLFGALFDMQKQIDLTAKRRAELVTVKSGAYSFADLPLSDAVKTVRGNGSRTLVVFSDPACGYCRKLENTLLTIDNVTVYTFLTPLQGPQAISLASQVWCASDPAREWSQLMLSPAGTLPKKPSASARCTTPFDRNTALANKLGVAGTPVIFTERGHMLVGAQERVALEQAMADAVVAQGQGAQ